MVDYVLWGYGIQKCLCIPLKDCPDGYRPRPGNKPGQAKYGWEADISICGSECDKQKNCLSFEHFKNDTKCLFYDDKTIRPPSKNIAFCTKGNIAHRNQIPV